MPMRALSFWKCAMILRKWGDDLIVVLFKFLDDYTNLTQLQC